MKARMERARLLLFGVVAGTLGACSQEPNLSSNTPDTAASTSAAILGRASTANEPVVSHLTTTWVAGLPNCTKYKATAEILGKPQVLNGEACRQADGSWALAEQPVGSDYVYQEIYVPPSDDSGWDGPCFYDSYESACSLYAPFGFSIGFPLFVDIHDHIHRFEPIGFSRFRNPLFFDHFSTFGRDGSEFRLNRMGFARGRFYEGRWLIAGRGASMTPRFSRGQRHK
jgi:hypothetical protein